MNTDFFSKHADSCLVEVTARNPNTFISLMEC